MDTFKTDDKEKFNYLVLIPAALFFIIQIFFTSNYPVFRDEFYYLECASRLSAGYVDQPPLSIIILAAWKLFFGDSLLSIRILPALFGSVFIVITGLLTRELGGNRTSQLFSAISVFCAPVYWGICSFYSMNSLDILLWVILLLILVKILNDPKPVLWILLGVTAGAGLMNKISVGFFGLALIFSLPFTPYRKFLKDKYFWLFGIISFIFFLPYIIWNVTHDWAAIEFMKNASLYKNAHLSPGNFIKELFLQVNPLNSIICITGIVSLFIAKDVKKYRILVLLFLFSLLIVYLSNGKPYYMAVTYPVLICTGSVVISRIFGSRKLRIIQYSYSVLLITGMLFLLPLVVPVLPPGEAAAYMQKLGIVPSTGENHKAALLPQTFADRFGWIEMTAEVANVFSSLPEEEKKNTYIFTGNYGEARAINYYGKSMNLPRAISGHNNFYFWPPDKDNITTLIVIGVSREDIQEFFDDVTEAGRVESSYSVPYENDIPVFIARKPKYNIKEIWPKLKHYI